MGPVLPVPLLCTSYRIGEKHRVRERNSKSVYFRWYVLRNQEICLGENQRWASSEWDQFHLCHSHLLRRQVTAAHRQILENWQYIRSQFFSSVKLSNTLLHFVLLTSPLFRMRVIMWHGSDGRRKDTKNRFWWHLRKSEKKKKFCLQEIGWKHFVKLEACEMEKRRGHVRNPSNWSTTSAVRSY